MGKTTGVSKTHACAQPGRSNTCYISYTDATRATNKYPMDLPQEFVWETQNTGVPKRTQRMVFPIITGVSRMTAVTGAIRHSYQILSRSHGCRPPMMKLYSVHGGNSPID